MQEPVPECLVVFKSSGQDAMVDGGFPVWIKIVSSKLIHEVMEGESEQSVTVTTNPVTNMWVSKAVEDLADLVAVFNLFTVKKIKAPELEGAHHSRVNLTS
jgi:hypothetical protein